MDTLNPIVNPMQVDIPAIEHELTLLWKSAAEPSAGANPVTRACTLNLVACAPDQRAAENMTNIIQGITGSHPNRAVLITIEPEAPETRLDVWVQANCQLTAPGAAQVCGEQISIDARGSASAQVASLVLALMLPDLPVVLWWPGPSPFDSPLFNRLCKLVDHVIVDSASFADPDHDLQRLAALLAERGTGQTRSAVSDLNWGRLTPWRELTAQFFDSRVLLPHLRRLDNVVIDYAHDPNVPVNRVPALLLVSWLATRLGWLPLEDSISVEGELVRLYLRRPAPAVGPNAIRLVSVELYPVATAEHPHGSLTTLRLLAVDNVLASFIVERTEDPNCLRTTAEVAGMPPMQRLARVERPNDVDLLGNELRLLSNERSFEEALRVAGQLAQRLG